MKRKTMIGLLTIALAAVGIYLGACDDSGNFGGSIGGNTFWTFTDANGDGIDGTGEFSGGTLNQSVGGPLGQTLFTNCIDPSDFTIFDGFAQTTNPCANEEDGSEVDILICDENADETDTITITCDNGSPDDTTVSTSTGGGNSPTP